MEDSHESFLRDLDVAHAFHPLLALCLALEKLSFSRYVTAIALRKNVLAKCPDRFARDYLAANGSLCSFRTSKRPSACALFE